MTSPPSSPAASLCPNCQSPAAGNFCSTCGASLAGATCTACQASLTPGARYCHRCGTEVGTESRTTPPAKERGFAAVVPWAVAAIALLALVANFVGQRFGRTAPVEGAPTAAAGAPPLTGGGAIAPGRAPDISSMSPGERAERLYDRVMSMSEQGKGDSVRLFAPMAIAAYEMLAPLTADHRYDLGRIGEVSGDAAVAGAQADTILREHPTHLLGLILAAQAARMRKDEPAAKAYLKKLAAAEPAERGKQLPEYLLHQNDITTALAEARK